MTEERKKILNKRLPRGLGIVVLIFSLGTIFWLSRNTILFGTKAAVGNVPKDIRISNIADNTFTVTYVTDAEVTGSIGYGKDSKLGGVAFDARDSKAPFQRNIHFVTISKLNPSTKYFFSIVSGDATFLKDKSLYEVTTASESAQPSDQTPISGQVSLDDGSLPTEAIAYVQSDKSQLLSALIKQDGSYEVPLNTIRKKDLSGILLLSPDTVLKLSIVNSTLSSQISLLASQTNPVPPVVLSKNYDFRVGPQPLATATSATTATDEAALNGFPSVADTTQTQTIQILTPKKEEEFKDQQPLFQGKALPGNDVEISIQSLAEITATVQSDNSGNWQYRPDTKLDPGQHTLTVKTLDESGILQTLTQSFTVFAQGSQFTEPSISPASPTPSTTPTTQPTSTPVPSPSPTIAPSPTTTAAPVSPTPIVIITTPIIATPSATTLPTITTPPIPKSGSSALIFGIIGTVLSIGIGGLIFLLI